MKLWQCLQPFYLRQIRIRMYKEYNRIDKLASWRRFFYIGVCGCALCAFYAFRILLCLSFIVLMSSRTHRVLHARLSINLQFVCQRYPIRSGSNRKRYEAWIRTRKYSRWNDDKDYAGGIDTRKDMFRTYGQNICFIHPEYHNQSHLVSECLNRIVIHVWILCMCMFTIHSSHTYYIHLHFEDIGHVEDISRLGNPCSVYVSISLSRFVFVLLSPKIKRSTFVCVQREESTHFHLFSFLVVIVRSRYTLT